ncbi:MAG: hypothetical protein AAB388_02740, partial [Patescibacteria group bacterium]
MTAFSEGGVWVVGEENAVERVHFSLSQAFVTIGTDDVGGGVGAAAYAGAPFTLGLTALLP